MIHHGDCIEVMQGMPADSIHAIVTDPPYGLGFMGKAWDDLPPGEKWAAECLRVLKPGGHLLAFGGTRTWHRLAVAVEDAGFEIRDSIAWLYGQGFPKSLDVGKAIDKAAGVEGGRGPMKRGGERLVRQTDDGARGWGTALKPAHEPIVVARKPLSEGTVAANVLMHGTGALNVDATRIGDDTSGGDRYNGKPSDMGNNQPSSFQVHKSVPWQVKPGRWPPNVALDESQAAALDEQSGEASYNPAGVFGTSKRNTEKGRGIYGNGDGIPTKGKGVFGYGDRGGASRFMYVAKAGTNERPRVDGVAHPTVKPLTLMRWLVRLVTPPGGTVLDPFAGSGTTIEAAILEGFDVVGIEREADYLPLIQQRIQRATEAVAAANDEPDQGALEFPA